MVELVPGAANAWKWVSMQMLAAIVALQGIWATQPELITAVIPASWVPYLTLAFAVVGGVGRPLQLKAKKEPSQ